MSTRKHAIVFLIAAFAGSVVFAQTQPINPTPFDPATTGSEAPRQRAEAIHNAREHGISAQPAYLEAEAPFNAKAQAAAEAKHLSKPHGNINDSADQRYLKEAWAF